MNVLFELMKLQGKIRIKLLAAGLDESEDIAADIIDTIMSSPLVADEIREYYQTLVETDVE